MTTDPTATAIVTSERNMRLIDLALDCVFITSSEKEKTIKLMEEKSKEPSDLNVLDIFRQEKFISDNRIERLLALDAHLQLHRRDQQFGRLAVVNNLASEQDIYDALNYQKACFKKNGDTIKIGDILVESKVITVTDRISILMTQNRIKDENLLDAINDIGETQAQKDAVNKRFGAMAIKKGRVTIEEVNDALDIQKREIREQGKTQFIGEILQETAELSENDLLQTLLEQKQFEKRRLDLEKALYTAKSEIRISKKLNKLFDYSISKDGLEASVKKRKETGDEIPVYEFLIWLRRAGIKFGIVDDGVLEEFIRTAKKNSQITVASGYPPEPCIDEGLHFYFENELTPLGQEPDDTQSEPSESAGKEDLSEKDREDETVEIKETGQEESKEETTEKSLEEKPDDPGFFKKGSILAQIIPGKEGKPGKDILGYPVRPDKPAACQFNAGNGVVQKGPVFIARIDGRPDLRNGKTLILDPMDKKMAVKTITGSISNDTTDTYESTHVELNGTITPEAVFRCYNLSLTGNLLGSAICDGDVDIKGNIGTDKTPSDTDTLQQALIICHGSLKAAKSIINSKIQTGGQLLAYNSTVTGSNVLACNGMTIKNSLNGETAPCILQFGLKPGDKILTLDLTIEAKNAELSVLKKEEEIAMLTEEYTKELTEEETRQLEQTIYKTLAEIIEAPEFYQYETLDDKINYLYRLPEFSSIRAYYLNIPETEPARVLLKKIVVSTEKMTLETALEQFKKKIDPEPEDKDAVSPIDQIKTNFKARLAVFEQEISNTSEEIEKMETEINGLESLRAKLGWAHLSSQPRPAPVIIIKNKCEKGTIIKGKIARLVLDKTLFNVKFKEVMDPGTDTVSIVIEAG